MTLPNFLLIGAAKSGTTALYMLLAEHPQIFMSKTKELQFFSYPETSKLNRGPDNFKRVSVTTQEEYENFFDSVQFEIAIGEASPSYLYFPICAERIHTLIPQTKIIAILRNPVDRAYSSYLHAVRDGWEVTEDFEHALNLEPSRIEAGWDIVWHYQEAGFYANRIRAYQALFPPEQMKIYLYDDLVNQPAKLIKEIYSFLEVDPEFTPHLNLRPNVSGVSKSKIVAKIMKNIFDKSNPLRELSRKFISPALRWKVTNHLRNMNLSKPHINPDTKKHLLEVFREDIEELQSLINRDLGFWLTNNPDDYA